MARLAKALNTEKAEEAKNKRKTKPQTSPQKATPNKTSNEAAKKDEEKMDVDTESTTKEVEKKATEESKKKSEKKEDKEDNEEKSKTKTVTERKNAAKGKNDKEDQDDWADVIDFELSDIVIIDEYDSSKNSEVIFGLRKSSVTNFNCSNSPILSSNSIWLNLCNKSKFESACCCSSKIIWVSRIIPYYCSSKVME